MTGRLIDADKLPRHGKRGGLVNWYDIKKAPTVDAVPVDDWLLNHEERRMKILKEVVVRYQTEDDRIVKAYDQEEIIRCKDCRHFNRLSCAMSRTLPYNGEHSDFVAVFRNNADDFCSKAERKEE